MGKKINSRCKGAAAEREVIRLLQPVIDEMFGGSVVLKRNLMQASEGGCDIIGLKDFAIEVKRCERLRVSDWWNQTTAQAQDGQMPVLFYRQSRQAWNILMSQEPSYPRTEVKYLTLEQFKEFLRREYSNA